MKLTDVLNEAASSALNDTITDYENHKDIKSAAEMFLSSYGNQTAAIYAAKRFLKNNPNSKHPKLTYILNSAIKRAKSEMDEDRAKKTNKGASRKSNEPAIQKFMEQWRSKNKVNQIKMDFEGTKLKKGAFSDLKHDQVMSIPGIPPFRFEAKKGDPATLTKGGILFAEQDKLYSNLKKAQMLADPKKIEKIGKHNEKMQKLYSPEIMAEIQKELGRKNENKPYLFIGGDTPESIRVVYPYQYWIDTNINSSYLPDRFEMRAKAKPKTKTSELLTLPEFFNRMMVENEMVDATKELTEGYIPWLD